MSSSRPGGPGGGSSHVPVGPSSQATPGREAPMSLSPKNVSVIRSSLALSGSTTAILNVTS